MGEQPTERPRDLDPQRWLAEHGDSMFRFAWRRLQNRDAAEDAVQEALLAALAQRDRYEGRSSERTWLIGILRYKVLDVLRARGRQVSFEVLGQNAADREEFTERGLWRQGPRRWSPASSESAEFWTLLAEFVAELPEQQRIVFTLRDIEGLETEEIGRLLEISPTNIWAALHRARRELRRKLEQRWGAP